MSVLLIPIVWVLDQLTKKRAEERLSPNEKIYIMDKKVSFQLVHNRGAFLGLLKDRPIYIHLFTMVALVSIVFMGLPFWFGGKGRITAVGLSLIFSGALGNYTDRIRKGHVVDFIAFAPKHQVYFNIADFFLFIGAGLLLIGELIGQ